MIVALVGPSGSGKSLISKTLECFYQVSRDTSKADEIYTGYEEVVVSAVKKLLPFPCMNQGEKVVVKEVISHTTRGMRKGETNGIHYHFVSVDEFMNLTKYEETLYCGNYYGLTQQGVKDTLEASEIAIVVVDKKGVENIKKLNQKVISLFLKTNVNVMEARMKERGDSEETILKRLQNAITSNEFEFDDADHVIENDGPLDETIKKVIPIIEEIRLLEKEHA